MNGARRSHGLRLALALVLLWSNLAGLPAPAQDTPLAGVIEQLKNQVTRQAGPAAPWQPAHLKDVIHLEDGLRTGPASVSEVHFPDGAISRLGPNSMLVLHRQASRLLSLLAGKLWFRLPRGGARTELRTSSAVASVTGTDVLVEVDGAQRTTITVLDQQPGHQVTVQAIDPVSGNPLGAPALVNSSQQIIIEPGRPAPVPQLVQAFGVLQREQSEGGDRPWNEGGGATASDPGTGGTTSSTTGTTDTSTTPATSDTSTTSNPSAPSDNATTSSAPPAPAGGSEQTIGGSGQYTVTESVQPAEVNTNGTWRPAVTGEVLTTGDRIRTGPEGKLSLALTPKVSMDVHPTTELVLGEQRGRPVVDLVHGEAVLVVRDEPPALAITTPYYLSTGVNTGTTIITDRTYEFQGSPDAPSYVIYKEGVVPVPAGERFVAIDKPAIPPSLLLSDTQVVLVDDSGIHLTPLSALPLPAASPLLSPTATGPGVLTPEVLPSPGASASPGVSPLAAISTAPSPAASPAASAAPSPAVSSPVSGQLTPPLPPLTIPPRDIGGTSPTTGGLNTVVK